MLNKQSFFSPCRNHVGSSGTLDGPSLDRSVLAFGFNPCYCPAATKEDQTEEGSFDFEIGGDLPNIFGTEIMKERGGIWWRWVGAWGKEIY